MIIMVYISNELSCKNQSLKSESDFKPKYNYKKIHFTEASSANMQGSNITNLSSFSSFFSFFFCFFFFFFSPGGGGGYIINFINLRQHKFFFPSVGILFYS